MKVIEEADVRDGFTRRITYHIPYSTRQIDRVEYSGPKQVAYCGHSVKDHLSNEDFSKYESVRDLPEGKYICGECVTQLSDQGVEDPYQKIVAGEISDPRLMNDYLDETDT